MKTRKILALLLLSSLASSCENFLNLNAISNVSENAVYKTTEDIRIALMGCYNGMQNPIQYEWTLTELRSDNTRVYTYGSTSTGYTDLRDLDVAMITTANLNISNYWDAVYNNIDRCNKIINSIEVVTDADLKKLYLGQALFIRAYHYYNLVRLFGGVFVVEERPSADAAAVMQRNSVDEVYALIERDLSRIVDEGMLPDSYDASEAGLITMVAAKTTLARAYATHYVPGSAGYAKALPLLDQAITAIGNPDSASDLVPFEQIFDLKSRMNDEIIFAVRFKSGGYGIGSPFTNYFAPAGSGTSVASVGSASGYNFPSDLLLKAYDSQLDEVRSTVNYALGYENNITKEWIETETSRYIKKYISPLDRSMDGDADWPVIRVSDLLLLYAEVDNEINGPTARSINYVNMVRQRADIGDLSNTKVSNKYEFRLAIQDERQLELAFENHRWFDLLRMGMALDMLNRVVYGQGEAFYGKFVTITIRPATSNDLLLPIPQDILAINPNVAQNPGY